MWYFCFGIWPNVRRAQTFEPTGSGAAAGSHPECLTLNDHFPVLTVTVWSPAFVASPQNYNDILLEILASHCLRGYDGITFIRRRVAISICWHLSCCWDLCAVAQRCVIIYCIFDAAEWARTKSRHSLSKLPLCPVNTRAHNVCHASNRCDYRCLLDIHCAPLVWLNNLLSNPSFICHSGLTTLGTGTSVHVGSLRCLAAGAYVCWPSLI